MTWTMIDLRRTGAALLVVFLHVLVILFVWHLTQHFGTELRSPRELVLRLWRLPPPAPAKPALPAPPIRVIVPLPRAAIPITPPPAHAKSGNIEGLHQWLFDCSPETIDMLTPEQRTQCASRRFGPNPDDANSVLNLPSRARDARHWQRALARKQNPALLPCANAAGLPLTPQAVICAANGIFGGFGDLDEQPGYGDAPSIMAHVPNNGDPPGEVAHH